jgi:hypothetical protein
MTDLLIVLGLLAAFALVVAALWWLAVRVRRRGGGDVLGPFDELWHPAAHRPGIEVQEQPDRRTPAPTP